MTRLGWAAGVLLAGIGAAALLQLRDGGYRTLEVVRPPAGPKALVLVFPDPAAPGRALAAARQLGADGALVAVVDTAAYLDRYRRRGGAACATLADDTEWFGKLQLRRAQVEVFMPALLVGDGQGAQLVRQVLAMAKPGVFVGAVATPADATPALPACAAPVSDGLVTLPADASADTLARTSAARFPVDAGLAGLPLVELPVPGSRRLAIVISGDGGWRELDQGIASELNRQGVAVVGWDSLRYFWAGKDPRRLGDDLARVIAAFGRRWQIDEVALVGYSFGADVLPFAYRGLPAALRQKVHFVALLGPSHAADFEVRVGGWLGWRHRDAQSILPQLARIDPARLQCIYGDAEDDSLCPELRGRGIEVLARAGGHHFDRDPAALARLVLRGWRRTAPTAAATPVQSADGSTRSAISPSASRARSRSPAATWACERTTLPSSARLTMA